MLLRRRRRGRDAADRAEQYCAHVYRIGLGRAGNVAAGAITTLVDRPLGVSGVTNPQAATGGQDPQSVDDDPANAPQSVLTLGPRRFDHRLPELRRHFAGIAKAYAIWIPSGADRGVFLTVAGAGGAALPPGNLTLANLVAALQNYGNPLIPIIACRPSSRRSSALSADVTYDPNYDAAAVQASVAGLLDRHYSFAARTFGQGVSADEIAALIQGVAGVVAVNVTRLEASARPARRATSAAAATRSLRTNSWLDWQSVSTLTPRQTRGSAHAHLPRICPWQIRQALPLPAEILVLDPDPNAWCWG